MPETRRRLLIIPAILLGIVIMSIMARRRAPAPRVEAGERATPVRYIEVQPVDVRPMALGYGSVEPARVWTAVSEVTGRVAELPDRVEAGQRINEGDLLLRIDETDYRLSLAQAQANLQATDAQLLQLDAQEQNYRSSLAIEEESLVFAEKEFERIRRLAQQGTASTSQLESQERSYLQQKQSVQNLKNSLDLVPADRASKQAQRAQQQALLEQAQTNLERTVIRAPFTARLAQVNVEQDQYVRQGEVVAVLDDMARAEIEAQLPTDHFVQLIPEFDLGKMLETGVPAGVQLLELGAVVRTLNTVRPVDWSAQFVRTQAGIDPQTRTVGVVVAVDGPYTRAKPPVRPPLVKGAYVAVELLGAKRTGQLIIPRNAVQGDQVYVITDDNRLERRTMEIGLRQESYVSVRSGLQPGDRVVVSDLVPAVDGMLLAPILDESAEDALRRAAAPLTETAN